MHTNKKLVVPLVIRTRYLHWQLTLEYTIFWTPKNLMPSSLVRCILVTTVVSYDTLCINWLHSKPCFECQNAPYSYMTLTHACESLHLHTKAKVTSWFGRAWSGMSQRDWTQTRHPLLWCAYFVVSTFLFRGIVASPIWDGYADHYIH